MVSVTSFPAALNSANITLPVHDKFTSGQTENGNVRGPGLANGTNGSLENDINMHPKQLSLQESLASAKNIDEIKSLVSTTLAEKLAAILDIDASELIPSISLSDAGLDFFFAEEYQSWTNSKLSASIDISESFEYLTFSELVDLVVGSSKLVRKTYTRVSKDLNGFKACRKDGHVKNRPPNLPLPAIDDAIPAYLASVEAIGTPEELAVTRKNVAEFLAPDSIGRKLHARLEARRDDPNLDCWLVELYNNSQFLDRKGPLVPFGSFFLTHHLTKATHGQAERAAIITVSAGKFKDILENGEVESETLVGETRCTYSMQWLFGTHRKPCVGPDVMEKFETSYIVVLRRGRVFKVELKEGNKNVSYEKLKATFEKIIDEVEEPVDWTGVLTADNRREWAKVRDLVEAVNGGNAAYLKVIEEAAFIVCLDDGAPSTAPERAYHYHFGDGSNRWWDKGLAFAICSNGISGELGEHAMIDAGTVYPLNAYMTKAIMAHNPDPTPAPASTKASIALKEFAFTSTPEIDSHIARVKKEYQSSCQGYEHRFLDYTGYGGSFPRDQKAQPKSVFQMVVCLASRHYFGYNPAFWDGVSLGLFYRGRVDINQVTTPPVVEFCKAADDQSIPILTRRKLLLAAARNHASNVTKCMRGRGFDRYLTCLRQVVEKGEEVPALFTDPVYLKSRPRKIMSHCHDLGMLEIGFVLRDPEAIWVHFDVREHDVRFSITGSTGTTKIFEDLLLKALDTVKTILISE